MMKLVKQCKYLVFFSLYDIIFTLLIRVSLFWHTLYNVYADIRRGSPERRRTIVGLTNKTNVIR